MENKFKWSVDCIDGEYIISYLGGTFDGKVRLNINGELSIFSPTLVKNVGLFVVFKRSNRDFVLEISQNYKDADLIVDGVSQGGRYDENIDYSALKQQQPEDYPKLLNLQHSVKSGMSSFFSVIILTLINNFLIMLNASVSFPFSLFFPSILVSFGMALSEEAGMTSIYVIGFVLAVIVIAVYAVFYFLSSKWLFAIWTAVVFSIIDTLLLIGFAIVSEDIASFLIDFAFHVWIVWALVKLAVSKKKLDATTKGMLWRGAREN